MLNDIYTRQILALAANIPHLGRLDHPDATATAHSKLCGSVITVDLALVDGKVSDFAHEVRACALGQASAAIMGQLVVGSTAEEIHAVREIMRRMLKENGAPPDGRWAPLAALAPVRDYPARHASTMLAFDAVADALTQAGALPAGVSVSIDQ
ncbi:iron-sulfur cluster assembly scaffold protein [Pseudochelatococcus sp. G4_1912]|uniref:iron-sulfur cluster assembly scaffold protein n=1 Tax=Pseudochelatococcus sp. G4_1912 TaxID=3114288 RepID=UPI0039C5C58D